MAASAALPASAISLRTANPVRSDQQDAPSSTRGWLSCLLLSCLASRRQLLILLSAGGFFLASPVRAETGPFSNRPLADCHALASQQKRDQVGKDPQQRTIWRELAVGDWLIVPNVCPQLRYFPTGLILTPGATYHISAEGQWKDGFLPATGPQGWPGLLLEAFNRIPWTRMASLSASVGRNEHHLQTIGSQALLTTPTQLTDGDDRRLYLFANDWPWRAFYANNRDLDPTHGGPMRVSIHRHS